MKNIVNAPFLTEICKTASNMYRLGWNERNGGNISVMLDKKQVAKYLDVGKITRLLPINFDAHELCGKYFAATGTGKYFKNIADNPETTLGVFRISQDGKSAELLWDYKDGKAFTSELPSHLMSHISRLKVDPDNRVIIHAHPTYTIAMNTICPIDENEFTHKLWQINTESIVVFPEGVGVLPWMVCGTSKIGEATAKKMQEYRLVIWSNHGIFGAGKDLDEAFGLIETVEKAAQIYMLTQGEMRYNLISDEQLKSIAERFQVTPKEGILA